MRNFLIILLMALLTFSNAFSQMTDADRQYISSNNILTNPGYENGKTGWTTTNGTVTWPSSGAVSGSRILNISLTAATLVHFQDSTKNASAFADGVSGLTYIRAKTTLSNIFVCRRQAGVLIANTDGTKITNCVSVNNDGKWGEYSIPTILGATSNGVAVVSLTPSTAVALAVTGNIDLDDSFVGATSRIQTAPVIGAWTTFTPTGAFTTNTTYTGRYRQVGQNIEVQYKLSFAGAANAVNATVDLPSGFTIDTSKMADGTTNNMGVGYGSYWDNSAGNATFSLVGRYNTTTSLQLWLINVAGSYASPSANWTNTAPATIAVSDTAQFNVSVPVLELSGSTSIYSASCGSSCAYQLSAKVSSTDVTSDENVDFINGNCTNGTTGRATCTYVTNFFTVTPNCVATTTSGTMLEIVSESASAITVQLRNSAGTTVDNSFNLQCDKTGVDFVATRTIIGSFKGAESEIYLTGGSGFGSTNTKIRRFTTVVKSIGSAITSSGDSATLGHSFTVSQKGVYYISYCDTRSTGAFYVGASVNSSQLTTNLSTITNADRLSLEIGAIDTTTCAGVETNLNAGDVVRAHGDGTANDTVNEKVSFRIIKTGN